MENLVVRNQQVKKQTNTYRNTRLSILRCAEMHSAVQVENVGLIKKPKHIKWITDSRPLTVSSCRVCRTITKWSCFVISAPWRTIRKTNTFLKGEIFSYCTRISWANVILWALRAVQLVGPHGEQNKECDRTKEAPLPTSLGPASARNGSEWNLVWKGLLCKGVHTFFCSTKYCRQKPVI